MDKQSSPPGREILVLPQQTVHTVHLGLQWKKVKLGKDLQCTCSSKTHGRAVITTCCKNKPDVIALCSHGCVSNGLCWIDTIAQDLNVTEQMLLKGNTEVRT